MNATRGRWRSALRYRPVIAGLLLGMFLIVLVMAHSWALHHSVCAEAASPGHKCAVTLLTGGQVHISSGTVTVTTTPVLTLACVQPEPPFVTVAHYSLLPSRGPPAFLP
jgi:hypothetical protein